MDPEDYEEDEYSPNHYSEDDEIDDGMKGNFPGSSREGRDTGRMLGVNFPYVAGDPFW